MIIANKGFFSNGGTEGFRNPGGREGNKSYIGQDNTGVSRKKSLFSLKGKGLLLILFTGREVEFIGAAKKRGNAPQLTTCFGTAIKQPQEKPVLHFKGGGN